MEVHPHLALLLPPTQQEEEEEEEPTPSAVHPLLPSLQAGAAPLPPAGTSPLAPPLSIPALARAD